MLSTLSASEVSLFDMNSWWWAICRGIYWVINAIEEAYGYLVGTKLIDTNASTAGSTEITDILGALFTDGIIQRVFLGFFIMGAAILLIFLAIGMIKASFQDNDQLASRTKMIGKSLEAFLLMVLLPLIMIMGVFATGAFLRLINGWMQNTMGMSGTSIAENLHQVSLPVGLPDRAYETIHFDSSYEMLKEYGANDGYQYMLAMISSGILIYVLIAICTSLVERLIEVTFMYLISPFVLARTPLDDGGSFKLWKDIVIAKLLSAAGIIISMYLYFILMGDINEWFSAGKEDPAYIAKNMVRVLFCIGGAFAVKKGSLTIAQVISQNTGISEGMAQGQSMHMLSSGLHLGMNIARGAIRGGLMGMSMAKRSGVNGGATALSAATSGAGRASIPVSTSAGGAGGMAAATGARAAAPLAAAAAPAAGAMGAGGAASPLAGAMGAGGTAAPISTAAPIADSSVVSNAAANPNAWTNGLLNNPHAPGALGEMNRANQSQGSLSNALLYGGAFGGIAYGGSKLVGLALRPFKAAGRAIKNSSLMQGRRAAREARKEHKKNDRTFQNRADLNRQVRADMTELSNAAAAINKKYGRGGKGYSPAAVNAITQARLGSRMRKIERNMRKLTSSGGAYRNTLNQFNRLANTNYTNDDEHNGGGKI